MRIVVTGGAGFLGSHLCTRLLSDGHEVVAIDNMLTGSPANVEHLIGQPGFLLVHHDVTNFIHVGGEVDYVFHFASPASPADFERLPIQILKVGALGTHKALGLAREKGAKFFLASTSEVYGDPEVSPQPESYWGNVNPIGIRGVYDEAKRFGESITMAYHRIHGIDTKIVRFFNSICADQNVVVFRNGDLHLEPVGEYAKRLMDASTDHDFVLVPAFDPVSLRMELKPASSLIKIRSSNDSFELKLRYGRAVKVTGDHSVFVRGSDGRPNERAVRDITTDDHVAIPARLPCVEKDRLSVNLATELISMVEDRDELWDWAVTSPELIDVVDAHREKIHLIVQHSDHYSGANRRNTIVCSTNRWRRLGLLPLYVCAELGIEIPADARFGPYGGGAPKSMSNHTDISSDLLWLCGFFLAEGSVGRINKKTYFLTFSSDQIFLDRAALILGTAFGAHVGRIAATDIRAPSIYTHSKALVELFDRVLGLRQRRIPSWVLQLPLSRLKYFLDGFRCGDGTHSGQKIGYQHAFNTVSEALANDLVFALNRFGLIASIGSYQTTYKRRYGDRRFPFYRVTVSALSEWDILKWDLGVEQRLNARRSGDLVWAKVVDITPCPTTEFVYDFSVPGSENFVAGTGVCCHNTFGPRMRPDDGRAIPEFINAALDGRPLRVFGDGSQTRSIGYVDDIIEGVIRLAMSDHVGPMNIGTQEEVSMLDLASLIIELAGGSSSIEYGPLPPDDPKVRRPDTTLAFTKLGWEPKVSREDGLKRTIDWFREQRNNG